MLDAYSTSSKPSETPPPDRFKWVFASLTFLVCLAHSFAIWQSLEGTEGLTNGWPLWRDDHPLYFHSAMITRSFLKASWTTAGYDPAFMSGYAKSVVFPASSTLPEVVLALTSRFEPAFVYKLYVLVSASILPWLIGLSCLVWKMRWEGCFTTCLLFLIYLWTDFPINYALFGMLPYLLSIPLALLAIAVFNRYWCGGGFASWFFSMLLMAVVVGVHLTSAMIAVPAALAAIGAGWLETKRRGERTSKWRLAGVLAIPLFVLSANAFWWLPGVWLVQTKGPSDFAFVHPEGVLKRLFQIVVSEARIELLLIAIGLLGLFLLLRTKNQALTALTAFILAGFGWGYLAGSERSLDFLQPGRHTYAFYTGLTAACGFLISILGDALTRKRAFISSKLIPAILLILLVWGFAPFVSSSIRARVLSPIPFLSSRPSPRLLWVVNRLKKHVARGERLLYEEGGFGIPGQDDPYQGGRFSGLLPSRLGIELIGGPYLHASLTTNFTQFGEDKLFGKKDWDRAWFVRYARLYRPAAILCWTAHTRAFCLANPDLVEIKEDEGVLMIGRVIGFEGDAIDGTAEVTASPGLLRVDKLKAGLDGHVILRYHSVPCLQTKPPAAWDSVFLEDDPVPFIRLRPPFGETAVDLIVPP